MQHVSQSADQVVNNASLDRRYTLTGSIGQWHINRSSKDGSDYVVLTLERRGKDPITAIAFDGKFEQVMTMVDRRAPALRLFGFFENREYADNETGEIKVSRRFRILWAGEPKRQERTTRNQNNNRGNGYGNNGRQGNTQGNNNRGYNAQNKGGNQGNNHSYQGQSRQNQNRNGQSWGNQSRSGQNAGGQGGYWPQQGDDRQNGGYQGNNGWPQTQSRSQNEYWPE